MDNENKLLTPREGCAECERLRKRVASARQSANSFTHGGMMTGYRPEKSRSRQYKQVRQQMDQNDNAIRLAQAELRIHEIRDHEGVTGPNGRELADATTIVIRKGRNRP